MAAAAFLLSSAPCFPSTGRGGEGKKRAQSSDFSTGVFLNGSAESGALGNAFETFRLPSQNNCRLPTSRFLLIVLQLPLCFSVPNKRLLKRDDEELPGRLTLPIKRRFANDSERFYLTAKGENHSSLVPLKLGRIKGIEWVPGRAVLRCCTPDVDT